MKDSLNAWSAWAQHAAQPNDARFTSTRAARARLNFKNVAGVLNPGPTAKASSSANAKEDPAAVNDAKAAVADAEKSAAAADKAADTTKAATDKPTSSPLSVGTFLGIAVALYNTTSYAITNNTVHIVESSTGWDYLQPAAFVLPSIALAIVDKTTISAIVPFGLTAKAKDLGDLNIGAGIAFGWTLKNAEVGLALGMVWQQQPFLNDAQRASHNSNSPLATGDSQTIGTKLMPSAIFGIYLTPQL